MADIGMAAFSPFFMQSPSFLAHQRHLISGTWQTATATVARTARRCLG